MKSRLLPLFVLSLPLGAQPSNMRILGTTNTQAILAYTAPDAFDCTLEVSESPSFTPLVHDVDPAFFAGSYTDSRPGNIVNGQAGEFVIGKRDMARSNAGANTGKYFSRALQADTAYYYRLTCTGGIATGSFKTTTLPFGNTFGETFQGDPANPGGAPYPYLDPTTRNSSYIDPQTGLKHVAVTFPSDYYENAYQNQSYSDAADVSGNTWANPTNVYGANQPATATTGAGSLWIGVRNTQASAKYDFPGRGPSYDDLAGYGANGSINYYQVSIQAEVSSGADVLQWCLTADRATCATPPATQMITNSLTTYTLGTFYAKPDGAQGGNGADPVLVNATPPINRWQAYTHMGTITGDGTSNLTWTAGNQFNTAWGSASIIRVSDVSSTDACTNGTVHNIASVNSAISITLADTLAAGTHYYCANNFGVLISRVSPDTRTVTLENAKFNLSYSPGPMWFSTADVAPISYEKFNNGYYFVMPPASTPMLLYFFDTSAGTSKFIGPMRPTSNGNGSSADRWNDFQFSAIEQAPFDDTATASAGHLVWYTAGTNAAGKQVILRGEYSGPPVYQGNSYDLCNASGATVTYPDLFSVQVANGTTGVTCKFTDITPSSQGKDLSTQMASVTGFASSYMGAAYVGNQGGKLYIQGRGNQDTIGVLARLDPSTGLIDSYTDTWSRPNCRWCIDHSPTAGGSSVDYMILSAKPSSYINNTSNGGGPWLVTTNDAIAASPGVACPANSIGAPTTGTACDTFTINDNGISGHNYQPYDPDPGTHDSAYLQDAQPGDWLCVTSGTSCSYSNEVMKLVSISGSTWTVWRPGTSFDQTPTTAISGTGLKRFFMWCTGNSLNPGTDGKTYMEGTGDPVWSTSTSAGSATWLPDNYFVGDHADTKFGVTFDHTLINGQYVEVCEEGIFCNIPPPDVSANGYRIRQGAMPGILTTAPSFVISTPTFAGTKGNFSAGSHLSVGGLVSSFTDDRPFLGDGMGCNWGDGTTVGAPVSGTAHVYKVMTCSNLSSKLSRKQIQTAAVAGPHVLKDISSAATGNQITDATDFSYCVALAANECRMGSTAGDVYVSASKRTSFTCYSGQSQADVFAPGGNVAEDICVFPASVVDNTIEQFSMTPDPVGWRYGRVLTYLTGKNKMDDAFANVRVMPDSSWVIGNERWGSLFRNEVVAIKLPATPSADTVTPRTINRSDYLPIEVQVQGVAGADGVVADFGYAEYGSDGVSKFYCMSRQENCVANQGRIQSTPFYWASESFSPLPCANGSTCKLAIPGIPGRTVYYRIRRTLAGVTVATEATEVRVTR